MLDKQNLKKISCIIVMIVALTCSLTILMKKDLTLFHNEIIRKILAFITLLAVAYLLYYKLYVCNNCECNFNNKIKTKFYIGEDNTCKYLRPNGGDPREIIIYKTNDGKYKKINNSYFKNIKEFIDRLNQDIDETKQLQNVINTIIKNAPNEFERDRALSFSKPRFTSIFRSLRDYLPKLSTKCNTLQESLITNKGALIASVNLSKFLNNLDTYLDTIIYPFMEQSKLLDNDSKNDILNITAPETFNEFNIRNNNQELSDYKKYQITTAEPMNNLAIITKNKDNTFILKYKNINENFNSINDIQVKYPNLGLYLTNSL
jgi:hypothetical protein